MNQTMHKLLLKHHPTYEYGNGLKTTDYAERGNLNKEPYHASTLNRLTGLIFLVPLTFTVFVLAIIEDPMDWIRKFQKEKKE